MKSLIGYLPFVVGRVKPPTVPTGYDDAVKALGGLGGTGLVAGVPLVVARQGRREPQYSTYWGD